MKKYMTFLFLLCTMCCTMAQASDMSVFPIGSMAQNGQMRYGLMNEQGEQTVSFTYADLTPIDADGLMIAQTTAGEVGVLNGAGKTIIAPRKAPQRVEILPNTIAYRQGDTSTYYTHTGKWMGTYPTTRGDFVDGLLCAKQGDKWGYVNEKGAWQIAPQFAFASDFAGGMALVQDGKGWSAIDPKGNQTPLDFTPAVATVYAGKRVIAQTVQGMRLYDLQKQTFVTEPYTSMTHQDDGSFLVERGHRYGILTEAGNEAVLPQFPILAYLGEGVYVAKSDSEVRLMDNSGGLIYKAQKQAGAFAPFVHGVSWFENGRDGITFISKTGAILCTLSGATHPEVWTSNVAQVQTEQGTQVVRLSDGKVLYTPPQAYTLPDGTQVQTEVYESYRGERGSGTFGWHISYPQLHGMKDKAVQKKINTAIQSFFLNGPAVPNEQASLVASYGLQFAGNVLVIYADGVVGKGEGSSIWNSSLTLDYRTGAVYDLRKDLFQSGYETVLKGLMSKDIPLYRVSSPRVSRAGITFFVNDAETATNARKSTPYFFSFETFWKGINPQGACTKAVLGNALPASGFYDVPSNDWARESIVYVSKQGWMRGEGAFFYPQKPITLAEAVATLARAKHLSIPPKAKTAPWYVPSMQAGKSAGILRNVEALSPDKPLTRAEAMQLFANVGRYDVPNTSLSALDAFTDGKIVPELYKQAVAWCIENQLVAGDAGKLHPHQPIQRAAFAKLLTEATQKGWV